jgi:hypothetical protein
MSLHDLHTESTIRHIVEAMLPRFSDHKLGLLMTFDMSIDDHGYGRDGGTRERRKKEFRHMFHFLFVRPSNYTKILVWEPDPDAKGLDLWPKYHMKPLKWTLLCDHDSCWTDAAGSFVNKLFWKGWEGFKKRKIGGEAMRPQDLSIFFRLDGDPEYVLLKEFRDMQGTTGNRPFMVDMESIHGKLADLVCHKSPDLKQHGQSGLMIRGSEDERRVRESYGSEKTA